MRLQVKYFVKDCANNISECEHVIEVIDRVPPSLSCPADITLISEPDACQAAFLLPTDYVLVENCETESYSVTEPEDEGFISFGIINTTTGLRAANSIFLQYNNTFPQGNLADPKMTIVAQGDLDDPEEYFTLFSESGQSLGQLNFQGANCDQAALLTINFDVADFTTWASDGQIFFTLVPNNDDPEKITNCGMAAFNSTDGVSFLRATVSYDDVFPNYEMRNLDGNTLVAISSPQDTAQLSIGNYEVEYSFTDATGNRDSCVFRVDVLDNTAPEISCSSIDTILVLPMVSGFMSYELDDFNITSQDNCGIANISIDPPTVSCSDAAEAQQLNLIAEDIHGNTNSCSTEVQVRLVELSPSFSSGLCVDDTLQLFANVNLFDPTAVLEYAWTGPDDFASSEMDPILLDINPMSTGTYHLELTDGNGCVFNGSVDVEVQALNSPEIFSDANVICEGEDILLNSTSFIESVNYLWYEGISPNGVLLTITPGPSFQVVNPTPGEHFYYVDIVGENCNTNASSTLQITVEALPSAQVANPFITVCEGEEIVLSSPVTDNDLEYFWSGPGGYESTGQFPELITNVDLVNQGSYSLVISKNGCVSDTAYSQVVVFPKPAQPIISGASVFCEGTNFVLSVNNVPNADNYQWYLDGVLYSNIGSNNLLIPAAQANLSGAWTVIVEAGICQSESSEEFEVLVNPLLTIGASNNGPICQGENVTLSASFIPNANYSWTSPSGLMYDGRVVEVLAEQGLYIRKLQLYMDWS